MYYYNGQSGTCNEIIWSIIQSVMDGLVPGKGYNQPRQKLITAKTQMSIRPLDLGLQNKFRPYLIIIMIINDMNINNNHKLFSPMNDQPYIKLVVIFYLLKSILWGT